MLSGIPFFEKNGIWRSNFSFVGDSSLFHTLKIRKCVTLDINFLPIDPNILSLNVSITFCLSFGVLIHKICGSSSFLIFFNPQNLQKQFFPLYFSQSTGRRGTFLSEEQIYNLLWHSQPTANCVNRTTLLHVPETNARANL